MDFFLRLLIPLHILQSLDLQRYSGYKPSHLQDCVLVLHDLQLNTRGTNLRAVRDKYMQAKVILCSGNLHFESVPCKCVDILSLTSKGAYISVNGWNLQYHESCLCMSGNTLWVYTRVLGLVITAFHKFLSGLDDLIFLDSSSA